MDKLRKIIKNILNKDVTSFLNKYKIPLVGSLIVVLLACIGLIVTYAFYQVTSTTPIIGGTTSEIPDLDIRIMAEERDANGNGLNSYGVYPYIPKAGYKYNSSKSYCTNGSIINYDATYYDADITSVGHDVCYLYFDSTAQLDITLNVYAENVDSDGEGTGEYTKLETTTLPSVGYKINTTSSSCQNGSSVTYIVSDNLFSVEAVGKDVCDVYMDAVDVDIALKIYVQAKKNSTLYYEAKTIPSTAFYSLGTQSTCTGTSTVSIQNQRVVINATGRTNCVAYLNVDTGPILESMKVTGGDTTASITLTNSNLGANPSTYYYSSDGGQTYTSSTESTMSFTSLSSGENEFKAYSVDASGNTSRIISTSTYSYYGLVDYSNQIQTKTISEPGYYKLETWGAQGGNADSTYIGGYGGYSVGYIYLNANDKLYVVIGGAGVTGSQTIGNISGGYNGGGGVTISDTDSGCNHVYGSGGGATHIAKSIQGTGLLSDYVDSKTDVIIVSGGGGGGRNQSNHVEAARWGYGGSGGGATAGVVQSSYGSATELSNVTIMSGTQTTGFAFGKGQAASVQAGGGGGWYGGYCGFDGYNYTGSGGGGSGYIGYHYLTNKIMYCYNCSTNSTDEAKTQTTTCHNANATENCAKEGNGFAIITYVGSSLE